MHYIVGDKVVPANPDPDHPDLSGTVVHRCSSGWVYVDWGEPFGEILEHPEDIEPQTGASRMATVTITITDSEIDPDDTHVRVESDPPFPMHKGEPVTEELSPAQMLGIGMLLHAKANSEAMEVVSVEDAEGNDVRVDD